MLSGLMMAVLSSLVPGFGLFGSIIEYITSDSRNSGKKFLVELATSGLPGGFLTNLGVNMATEAFLGNEIGQATRKVTPYNEISRNCSHCSNSTHYYVAINGRISCADCLSDNLSRRIRYNDKVYVIKNGVYQVHSTLQHRNLNSRDLTGRTLDGRGL